MAKKVTGYIKLQIPAEISAEGVSIYQHDPKGKVASAYQSLTEEVLGNE